VSRKYFFSAIIDYHKVIIGWLSPYKNIIFP